MLVLFFIRSSSGCFWVVVGLGDFCFCFLGRLIIGVIEVVVVSVCLFMSGVLLEIGNIMVKMVFLFSLFLILSLFFKILISFFVRVSLMFELLFVLFDW